jgi:xylulokinase
MGNGGSAISWAARLMGLQSGGVGAVDDIIRTVSPGSEGLIFWPLLAGYGGAGLVDNTPGRLTGLRLHHGQAHVLRSVVEGLCLELGRYLLMLQEASVPAERLLMCGGGAASEITPQIIADITGMEVACTTEPDTSALGAAMLARGIAQAKRPLVEISAAMAPSFRTYRPGADSAVYQDSLERYIESMQPLAVEKGPA